jgi:transmembrane sensor
MSNLTKIIRYFFYHDASDEMVNRVHRRLSEPGDEEDKEQILQTLWEETNSPALSSEQARQAFSNIEKRIGFASSVEKKNRLSLSRISVWLRIAAIWLLYV